MKSVKIEPCGAPQSDSMMIEIECDCGKRYVLQAIDGGHPTYCPNCEKAYYLRSHLDHYHIRTEHMTRHEILQQTYGRFLARA